MEWENRMSKGDKEKKVRADNERARPMRPFKQVKETKRKTHGNSVKTKSLGMA